MNIRISCKIIVVMMCLVAFNSCGEKEKEDPAPTLSVSISEISLSSTGFGADGNPAEFTVSSSDGWTITCDSWLTPSVTSGQSGNSQVSVTATETAGERIGYITVQSDKSSELRCSIKVTQSADPEPPELTVSPMSIDVKHDGNTIAGNKPTITVTTNKNWTITDLPAWVTATPSSGNAGTATVTTVTLTAQVNDGEGATQRTGSFSVNAGGLTREVSITQLADDGTYLNVSTTTIGVKFDGTSAVGAGAPVITISASDDWTIKGLPTWITASATSGNAGDGTSVTLTVTSIGDSYIPRNATFTVEAGIWSIPVSVEQAVNGDLYEVFRFVDVGINPQTDERIQLNNLTVTNHGNYWDIIYDTDEWPGFSGRVDGNCRGASASVLFIFEYQVVSGYNYTDFSGNNVNLVPMQDDMYNFHNITQLVKLEGGDTPNNPNNEELWLPFSYEFKPAIAMGWGNNSYIRFDIGFGPISNMLLRNPFIVLIKE